MSYNESKENFGSESSSSQFVTPRQTVDDRLEDTIRNIERRIGQLQMDLQSFLAPYEDQKKNAKQDKREANERLECLVAKQEEKIDEVVGETKRCHENMMQKIRSLTEELKCGIQDEIKNVKSEQHSNRKDNESILEELASIKSLVETLICKVEQREEREGSESFLHATASLKQLVEMFHENTRKKMEASEELNCSVRNIQGEIQNIKSEQEMTRRTILQELASTKCSVEELVQNGPKRREKEKKDSEIILQAIASLKLLVEENERKREKDMVAIESREQGQFVHVLNLADLDKKNGCEKTKNGKEKKSTKSEPITIQKPGLGRSPVFGSFSPENKKFKFPFKFSS